MAEGFKIASGYLDIQADTDGALSDVRAFLKRVDGQLDAGEKKFRKSGEQSGKSFVAGIDDEFKARADSTFRTLTDRATETVRSHSRRSGGLLGAMMGGGRGANLSALLPGPGVFKRMFGGMKSGGKSLMSGLGNIFSGAANLFSGITKGITSAFSSGVDQAQKIWQSASGFFQQAGNIGGGLGGALQFGAMGVAGPLVLGLAGALAHLSAALLALPAAGAVAVAAIAPLIVAFKGFGEAVSAGMSGDVEAFNEALKKLTPSARSVAKDIVALGPALSNIKKQTQEGFFNQLVGQIDKLNPLLSTLATGMGSVGGALGHLAKMFIGLLSAPGTIQMINNLFSTTTRIIDDLAEPMINLFGGVFDLINAGLPWVERFMHVLGNGLQDGANWLEKILQPGGEFTGWMERAWNVGKQLWEVVKGIGQIAGTMLNAFGDEGTDTLTGLAEKLREINQYLQSDEGAETLHNLGVIVHWAGNAFVWFVGTLTAAWKGLNAVFSFVRGIGPFFSNLWDSIVSGVKGVGNWFVWLGTTIWGGITSAVSAIGDFFAMIGNGFVTAYNAVVSFGGKVVDWFVALPGRIGAFFASLPGIIGGAMSMVASNLQYLVGYLGGMIATFFVTTLPNLVRSGWNWAVQATFSSVAAIVSFVTALPGQIWGAMTSVASIIQNALSSAWEWAKSATINGITAIISWANGLPGRISGALSRLMDAIGGWFSRTWEQAKSATASGVNSVMNFIGSLPGRISGALSGAASWLYSAGRDAIRGLVNGLESALSWAVNAARNAANRIKDGFLDALSIGSPSKVMDREVGRWILPGVVQGMEHTMPDMDRYLGATADRIRGGFNPVVNVAAPSVSVGGTTLIADLGDGIRQAVPVQIMRNSRTVATAANVGNRRNAAWTNTGRTVITGT